jgi:hypothetical protein
MWHVWEVREVNGIFYKGNEEKRLLENPRYI